MRVFALRSRKQFVSSRLIKALRIDEHMIVIVQRPKALVKHPVRVFAKRHAIARVVIPAISELVDMCSFYNTSAIDSTRR